MLTAMHCYTWNDCLGSSVHYIQLVGLVYAVIKELIVTAVLECFDSYSVLQLQTSFGGKYSLNVDKISYQAFSLAVPSSTYFLFYFPF